MREYILLEKKLHPYALPQDYIKLIFQHEFGPGHLIADKDYAQTRLVNEWQDTHNLPYEAEQDIGNGYVRVSLKGLDEAQLVKLNEAFVKSANEGGGSDFVFESKLDEFVVLAKDGAFAFGFEEAKAAVKEYLSGGIRPTSHTKQYHEHYKPAYRVVKKEYWK
ncbi:MAG: hypothetical protein IJN84_03085 [Clostridia bacterium]|nr:hypothetical protein [Clostridia bacterium]